MGSFVNGFCVGLGLSLLFAPKKGEEMRQLVGERIRYLRGMPPENQVLSPSIAQMGTRLQEIQNRAEPARPMGTTAPTASPVQKTTSSAEDVQQILNRAAQQTEVTTPTTGTVQETVSSTEDVQQRDLNRAARQMGATTPDTTPSSVEEAQKDLNRATRQPGTSNPPPQRRPGGLTDQ